MDKAYLKYTPEIKPKPYYYEVWQGLPFPRKAFREEPLADSDEAWSYRRNGFSIWVPNNAVRAYKENSKFIFIALAEQKRERKHTKTEIKSLRPYEGRLEDAIAEAKDLNSVVKKWQRRTQG
jgi:hypothetical protein